MTQSFSLVLTSDVKKYSHKVITLSGIFLGSITLQANRKYDYMVFITSQEASYTYTTT